MCANHQRFCLFSCCGQVCQRNSETSYTFGCFSSILTKPRWLPNSSADIFLLQDRHCTARGASLFRCGGVCWGCGVRRGWRWRGEAESSVVFIVPNDQWHPLIIFTLHCFGLFTSLGNLNVDNCILYQEITATEEIDKKCLRTCCCFITITILHY